MNELTKTRRATNAVTRSFELPECFAFATSASYARILAKRVSRRSQAERNDAERLRRAERELGR